MNIKKLLLIGLLGLSVATVRPTVDISAPKNVVAATGTLGSDTVEFITAEQQSSAQQAQSIRNLAQTAAATLVPSFCVGAFTGTAIGYLSGKLFDAAINQQTISALQNICGANINVAIAVNLLRLGAQIGSKFYWERPLRHKFMNWLITTMKEKGIKFDEEMAKTTARVAAWWATADFVNTEYSLALKRYYANYTGTSALAKGTKVIVNNA